MRIEPRMQRVRAHVIGCAWAYAVRTPPGPTWGIRACKYQQPWPGGPRPRPQSDPCSARSPDPECTRPVVPNENALMMRMRPFWVNGGPFPIKMLW